MLKMTLTLLPQDNESKPPRELILTLNNHSIFKRLTIFIMFITSFAYAEPDFHLLMTLQGESPGDAFSTVVGLGDFNQDGYDDFAVGGYKGNYVNIYYGSSSPDTCHRAL
ncbi:MAG: integrin alpha [Candidatus Marinimicrobia bacterium]|nr:integrin alpha [Candidatus Neomarinimicrobiota bacterium]